MTDCKKEGQVRIDTDRLVNEMETFTARTGIIGVAAKGLARPLMDQQAGASSFERLRAEARYGKGSARSEARRVAEARTQAARIRFEEQFQADLSEPPATGAREAGLYGTVTRKGVAQPGLLVGLVDEKGSWAGYSCTDRYGAYAFTLSVKATGHLRVQEKDGAPLYQERDSLRPLVEGQRVRRDVELDGAHYCPPPGPRPEDGGDDGGGEVDTVVVPNLAGLSEDEAVSVLRETGLNRGKRDTKPSEAQPGSVLDQTPKAGTQVGPGTAVDILVATELQQRMPKVTEMPVSLARATLKEVGLGQVSERTREAPNAIGLVLEQDPQAGTEVNGQTQVTLVVGVDAAIVMPRLVGQKADSVREALAKLGVKDISVEKIPQPEAIGLVIKQSPKPGSTVDSSTKVTLVIGARSSTGGDLDTIIDRMAAVDTMERRRLSPDRLTTVLKSSGATSRDDLKELSELSIDNFNNRLNLGNKAMAKDIRDALRISLEG